MMMSDTLFARHQALLDGAVQAIHHRGYWSPFPEMPSPKIYGEHALADGKAAVLSYHDREFPLHDQGGIQGWIATERSPYGVALAPRYPVIAPRQLVAQAEAARGDWHRLGAKGRVGVLLEALVRLNQRSMELAHAVMFTTGQGWMMAFQAGGPHAQDRGLEAVAYAWEEMRRIPEEAIWEKPQGKNPPLRMVKRYEIVGRGVGVVIGCGTFPTWNTYPGLFAALATGNPVIVKPHSNAVLPAAITVRVLRDVLAEVGCDPNVVQLAVFAQREATQELVQLPQVKMIDFTGGCAFGQWLIEHCPQAQVYAELAGVNTVVVESTDDYEGMLKNLAFTLSLYSGQMCTTTQAILVPAEGVRTNVGVKSYDEVARDLAQAIDALLADPRVAFAVLGAVQSSETLARIDAANRGDYGAVVRPSTALAHPEFPQAVVRTPVLLSCDERNEAAYLEERFGPIAFVVRCANRDVAAARAEAIIRDHGALTLGCYSTDPDYQEQMVQVSLRAGVALSFNLTDGVYVNQSAAFSDYHGTGLNPAANASYCDAAFVARRFAVVQRRWHVAP
jgi:phenylacetic acid degradation protein paaN